MEKQSYEFDEKEWEYLAEGNQHIILKYSDSSSENYFYDKILKIEKEEPSTNNFEEKLPLKLNKINEILDHYIRQAIYEKDTELLAYLPLERKIFCKNKIKFYDNMVQKIDKVRPEFRKVKKPNNSAEITISENLTLLYPNTKGFIIEIKPKCPFAETISKQEFDEIFNKSFSQHKENHSKIYDELESKLKELRVSKIQIFKQKSEINKKFKDSNYDPCNLFSGELVKIKSSIEKLIMTPSNNLIFHLNNSNLDQKHLIEGISTIISQNTKLMEKIMFFQKMCQRDHHEIKKLSEKLNIEQLFSELTSDIEKCSKESILFKEIIEFLVALTWKDLGIIINFVQNENNIKINENLLKNNFKQIDGTINGFYKIGLIDIKLKDIKKFQNFFESQSELNEVYVSHLVNSYILTHNLK